MTMLSSAAWVAHDVGLATAIGGTIFEQTAMAPALERATSSDERDRISLDAAQRFSWVKLLSHASFAIPWFIGRTMRSGREVSAEARALTRAKDVLVGISLVSGLVGLAGVKRIDKEMEEGDGRTRKATDKVPVRSGGVGLMSLVNVLANVGILGITALLAMEASTSVRFAASSRKLP